MALTNENNGGIGATMLVGPTGYGSGYGGYPVAYPMMPMMGNYGGGMLGGDFGSLIVLFLFAMMFGGGFGGYGMGGFGGGLGYDFPWLLNGQNGVNNNVSSGFRDAQLHDSVTSVRDGVSNLATQLCDSCGNMQMAMANGFAGTNATITGAQNALSQQMYSNELASLNRSFAEQTANAQGFTNVNNGIADVRYTISSEGCNTRNNATQNTQTLLTALTAGVQSIKDQLCDYRNAQKDDTIATLRQELLYARGQASQDVQTAAIRAGQATTANQLIQEMRSCPVPSMPVYGMTPIFSCPQNQNPGCVCGG